MHDEVQETFPSPVQRVPEFCISVLELGREHDLVLMTRPPLLFDCWLSALDGSPAGIPVTRVPCISLLALICCLWALSQPSDGLSAEPPPFLSDVFSWGLGVLKHIQKKNENPVSEQ